jgi:flagellin-like hook-associated protein FlgL
MTTFTKLQVLEQAGMSVLGQANNQAQAILSLIKNG